MPPANCPFAGVPKLLFAKTFLPLFTYPHVVLIGPLPLKKGGVATRELPFRRVPKLRFANKFLPLFMYPHVVLIGPLPLKKGEVATRKLPFRRVPKLLIVTPPRGPGGRAYLCKRGDRGGARRRTRSSRHPAAAVLVRVGHTKPIPKVGPVTDPCATCTLNGHLVELRSRVKKKNSCLPRSFCSFLCILTSC